MPNRTPPSSGERARRHAYEQLRDRILSGTLAPGQRLLEPEFAGRFQVNRASMRAALIDLAAEGLVERIPNRGSRVRVVSVDEAVAITECRMTLEGLCAAKAATFATDRQIDELNDLSEQMTEAVAEGAFVGYSDLNRCLHTRIVAISGQHPAGALLKRLNAQLVRHHFELALRPGRPQQSLREHLAVIKAIRARDPQAAEAAARAHLISVIRSLRTEPALIAPLIPHPTLS
ncbi:GntR family transcriptional regulator [Streptomyces phaeochromogenes]